MRVLRFSTMDGKLHWVFVVACALMACSETSTDADRTPSDGSSVETDSQGSDAGPQDASLNDSSIGSLDGAIIPYDGGARPPIVFGIVNPRVSNTAQLSHPDYDYAPSIMLDGNYRMWWCGQGGSGDHIYYAEAESLDGPWHAHGVATPNTANDLFQPTGKLADFDGQYTCDPSVVRVNGKYYMYYGGAYPAGAPETDGDTRVGLAVSDDGYFWTRANGGKPIVVPARNYKTVGAGARYGAGQPSVVYVDGKFYMTYTDLTGYDGDPNQYSAQYVLRSPDPTFQTGVEELGASGFAPYSAATHAKHALVRAVSVDWMYSDAIDCFIMAVDGYFGDAVGLLVWDKNFNRLNADPIRMTGDWREGPGLVTRPDKHANPGSDCGSIPIDVMRALGPGDNLGAWDLGHTGADLTTGQNCGSIPLDRLYEGSRIASAGLPLAAVFGGQRLQFALAPPAVRLARTEFQVSAAIFNAIPYGASLSEGAPSWVATGRPNAFFLDDKRLWPYGCLELRDENHSLDVVKTPTEFDAVAVAASLQCLR